MKLASGLVSLCILFSACTLLGGVSDGARLKAIKQWLSAPAPTGQAKWIRVVSAKYEYDYDCAWHGDDFFVRSRFEGQTPSKVVTMIEAAGRWKGRYWNYFNGNNTLTYWDTFSKEVAALYKRDGVATQKEWEFRRLMALGLEPFKRPLQ